MEDDTPVLPVATRAAHVKAGGGLGGGDDDRVDGVDDGVDAGVASCSSHSARVREPNCIVVKWLDDDGFARCRFGTPAGLRAGLL